MRGDPSSRPLWIAILVPGREGSRRERPGSYQPKAQARDSVENSRLRSGWYPSVLGTAWQGDCSRAARRRAISPGSVRFRTLPPMPSDAAGSNSSSPGRPAKNFLRLVTCTDRPDTGRSALAPAAVLRRLLSPQESEPRDGRRRRGPQRSENREAGTMQRGRIDRKAFRDPVPAFPEKSHGGPGLPCRPRPPDARQENLAVRGMRSSRALDGRVAPPRPSSCPTPGATPSRSRSAWRSIWKRSVCRVKIAIQCSTSYYASGTSENH